MAIKVEVLYFDGCPTYQDAERALREVLAERGMDAEVELVALDTDEETRRLRSPATRPVTDRSPRATRSPPEGLREIGCGRIFLPCTTAGNLARPPR